MTDNACSMPATSTISFLQSPPPPAPSNNPPPATDNADGTFQDSLDSACQKQSASTDDSSKTSEAKSQPAKKSQKPTKAKGKNVKPADDADSADDAEKQTAEPTVEASPTSKSPDAKVAEPSKESTAPKQPQKQIADVPTANPVVNPVQQAKVATPAKVQTDNTAASTSPAAGKAVAIKADQPTDQPADQNDTPITDDQPVANPEVTTSKLGTAKVQGKATHAASGTSANVDENTDSADTNAAAGAADPQALPATADPAQSAAIAAPDADKASPTIQPASSPATFASLIQPTQTAPAQPHTAASPAAAPSTDAPFIETNHQPIVQAVHSQLLPNGGTMQIRLDPPELGALQVTVHMRDGVMTASFETSNDQATRLLSHTMGQLKTALETAGVSVEKMHVQQSPRQDSRSSSEDSQQQKHDADPQQQQSRHEQQRREVLNRLWPSSTAPPIPSIWSPDSIPAFFHAPFCTVVHHLNENGACWCTVRAKKSLKRSCRATHRAEVGRLQITAFDY